MSSFFSTGKSDAIVFYHHLPLPLAMQSANVTTWITGYKPKMHTIEKLTHKYTHKVFSWSGMEMFEAHIFYAPLLQNWKMKIKLARGLNAPCGCNNQNYGLKRCSTSKFHVWIFNIHSKPFVMYVHLLLYLNVTGKQFFAFAVNYVSDSFIYSDLQFAERVFCCWHCSKHYMHYIADVWIPSAHWIEKLSLENFSRSYFTRLAICTRIAAIWKNFNCCNMKCMLFASLSFTPTHIHPVYIETVLVPKRQSQYHRLLKIIWR